MYILFGVMIIINLVTLIILKFTKRKIFKILPIIGCFIMGYLIFNITSTKNLLSAMNVNYKTNNYAVIVLKDSSYEKIKDLNNKQIGYLNDDEVFDEIKIPCEKKQYSEATEIINSLLEKENPAIILEKSYIDMFSDSDSPIKEFKDKIKIIYEFSINNKIEDISKDIDITSNPFVLYISGIDTYGKVASVSRTDVNMVVVVNPNSKQILMVSIPRDYYVKIAGKNGKDKLTHSGIYGIETSVKTVEDLLDIDINYYYKINFTSLIKIVNSLGGVDAYSAYKFTSISGYTYQKGYNHMNGEEALAFVRERKAFAGGDRVRNQNQQALMEALFRKCTNPSIIVKYTKLLNSLKGSFITNMPSDRLTDLIKMQLEDNAKWTITSYGLDGSNGREYTYTYKTNKLYVMIPNQSTITKAKQLISDVKNGNKLTSSYQQEVGTISQVTKQNNKKTSTTNKPKTETTKQDKTSTVKQPEKEQTKEYVITYIDGETRKTQKVKEGSLAPNLTNQEQEGFKFLGWYDGNQLYDFNKPVNSDLVLEAKYEQIFEQDNDKLLENQ